jgi:hypothetical protein
MHATVHGRILVRPAALPSTSAVPARRVVPSGHLLATLRYGHLPQDGHAATTRLSTPLFDDRHSHGRRTRMPATLHLRRGGQCLDPMPPDMPTGRRNEQHDDDRLPSWPTVPAASMPYVQRQQPVLSVSRTPEQRLR